MNATEWICVFIHLLHFGRTTCIYRRIGLRLRMRDFGVFTRKRICWVSKRVSRDCWDRVSFVSLWNLDRWIHQWIFNGSGDNHSFPLFDLSWIIGKYFLCKHTHNLKSILCSHHHLVWIILHHTFKLVRILCIRSSRRLQSIEHHLAWVWRVWLHYICCGRICRCEERYDEGGFLWYCYLWCFIHRGKFSGYWNHKDWWDILR